MSITSPPRKHGPLGPAIDNHTLPPLPLGEESWRLFSPASKAKFGVSRKTILPSVPPPSPRYIGDHLLMSKNVEKMEEVYKFVPQALSHHRSASDEHPPGLIDDHSASSDSDTSSDEERYQTSTAELWNTYHDISSAPKLKEHQRPRHPEIFVAAEIFPSKAARFPAGYQQGVEYQHDFIEPKPVGDLHRSKAQRNPRRAPVYFLNAPPPLVDQTSHRAQPQNHNTWPLRTPMAATPLSLYPKNHQRGDIHHTPTAQVLSHARSSPNFRSTEAVAPEKSAFDDDSDDDGEPNEGKISFAGKLHIRNLSTGSKADGSPAKPKRRSLRRSASDVIKDIFHLGTKR